MADLLELEAPPQSSGDTSETAGEGGALATRAPGTPLGTLFRGTGTSNLSSASEGRADQVEEEGSVTHILEDRPQSGRVWSPAAPRAAQQQAREDPDEDPELLEEAQGTRGSVARMVRERDADRVAAADERSLRLSIKGSEEPSHRLAAFAGPRVDPSTSMDFEELWGPRIYASFFEAMIAFTRSPFGAGNIWQEWYSNACAIRKMDSSDPRAPKRGENTMAFYAELRRRI